MEEIPNNPKDLDYYTDLPVGEVIRRTRESYGQTLSDVEGALRIRSEMLDAIERGDLEKLPGRVYAIGFVRSYAEYLNLDGDRIVHLFKIQSVGGRQRPDISMPAPVDNSKIPSMMTVISSTVLALAILIFWVNINQEKNIDQLVIPKAPTLAEHESNIQEILEKDISESIKKVDVKDINQVNSNEVMGEQDSNVVFDDPDIALSITEKSWIQIKRKNGDNLISTILKPGHYYAIPENEELFLTTGNAAGVVLILKGKKTPALGEKSELIRNLPLTIDAINEFAKKD